MIDVRTLTDGGQAPRDIAASIAAFVGTAVRTLDLALYDLRLGSETSPIVRNAVRDALLRGVAVRLAYNVDHRGPIPVPPPSSVDEEAVAELGVAAKPIPGIPDLMHHKYVVRDGSAVWTGSTNWTDDSWSREENVIVTVDSEEVAAAYARNFERLWLTGDVAQGNDPQPNAVDVGGVPVRAWFCPAEGPALAHRIAHAMHKARRRIRIASPVVTSGPIISTLAEIASLDLVDIAGVVDLTQMQEVLYQWEANGHAGWKIETLFHVLGRVPLSGKPTTPWGPGTVHDYMHAKVTVADDTVFVGSYNLSHSGERNAENVLELRDPALADRMAAFVDQVRGRYPAAKLHDPRPVRGARGWARGRRRRQHAQRVAQLGLGRLGPEGRGAPAPPGGGLR